MIYRQPLYYEVAFDFINPRQQVDLFEKFIKKHSRVPVARFLDLGCGPSLQLREIARRGYHAVGLDLSGPMLTYLRRKAREEGVPIETIRADLTDFRLGRKVDFVFIMMGTIAEVTDNERMLHHLDCVARAVKRGGLYLIENFRLDWSRNRLFGPGSWTRRRGKIRVRTTYDVRLKDTLTQMITETLRLEVEDDGRTMVFEDSGDTKFIFPQELLALIRLNGKFEFLGFFERFRMRKLRKASLDNIVLLRRK